MQMINCISKSTQTTQTYTTNGPSTDGLILAIRHHHRTSSLRAPHLSLAPRDPDLARVHPRSKPQRAN